VDDSGTQANDRSGVPYISSDGRFVVFASAAANLVPGDTNGVGDVFVRDRRTRVTERVSLGLKQTLPDPWTQITEKFKVGEVGVTMLDVHGTYKFKKAPFIPDSKAELRHNHRMLAVVLETPSGNYYLKLVGPAATIEQNKKAFDSWLKAFK
jgi:hypothetical protein